MKSRPLDQALAALEWNHATIPYLFFTKYHSLGLSDQEAMVVFHIVAYQQVEHSFPSLDELSDRMSLTRQDIAMVIQRLLGDGFILHEGQRVSIRPLLEKMVGIIDQEKIAMNVFTRFEEEFGRLLSPLEYEQIVRWIEVDTYAEWMIIEALRESILAGVYNFRYVDTVLRDWGRAHIKTQHELTDYLKRHKQRNDSKDKTNRKHDETFVKPTTAKDKEERVVPAAQPGKYERFYQLYQQAKSSGNSRDSST